MDGTQTTASDLASVEATLRETLAQGDAVLSAATPSLRRALAHEDRALLNDETVARVRGMLADLALQLLEPDPAEERHASLSTALAQQDGLLTHLHALAVEGRLTDRLEADSGIDPVLPPLLKGLIAGDDEVLASAAMAAMTAQASFVRQQRDMRLALGELPADLFLAALGALRSVAGEIADGADSGLRRTYDEGSSRLAILGRLVVRTGSNASGALDVATSGLGVFVTALSLAAGQDRAVTALSLSAREPARLVLALRAAGLSPAAVRAQSLYFQSETGLLDALADVRADRAGQILAAGDMRRGR